MSETLDETLDKPRLESLLMRVRSLMLYRGNSEGTEWFTLAEIRNKIDGGSEAGISARLRELRSLGYKVLRRRRGDPSRGLWEYRLNGEMRPV